MKSIFYKISKDKILLPLLTLFFSGVYLYISYFCTSDIDEHANFAISQAKGDGLMGNFVLYGLVNLLTFFSLNFRIVTVLLCVIIGAATTAKYYISKQQINKIINPSNNINYKSVFLSLSLIFVFAIPIPTYFIYGFFYRGNFVPNVWNNSTTILLAPIAILLFLKSYEQLKGYSKNNNIIILILIILNIFIKPSYFFVFICVYPIFLLLKYKFKKEFFYACFPIAIGLICLIIEYILIYKSNSNSKVVSSSVMLSNPIKFIETFPMYKSAIFSIIFSTFFPLIYSIFNVKQLKKSTLFWYTVTSFFVSILFFVFLIEEGPRKLDGNFYWQIVICTWLCFFVALLALLKDIKTQGSTKINKLLFSIFTIHVLLGVIYFSKYLITGIYY